MPEDHRTVLLSITATVIAGLVLLGTTVATNGGAFSMILFKEYVLPLMISAFTLFVFFVILIANKKAGARKNNPEPVVKV